MESIFNYIAGSLPLSIVVTVFTVAGLVAVGFGIYKLFKK